MKKLLFGICLTTLLGSCKKDYTCECYPGERIDAEPATFTIHDTKKKARETCENTLSSYGPGTCKLR